MRHKRKLTIAIVASGNGSVLDALAGISSDHPVEWRVITDRECGAERVAERHNLNCERIDARDNREFSKRAAEIIQREHVDAVLLLFVRLVTVEVFGRFMTFNLHPSLLPAFPGFGAVRRAREAGVGLLGATLHLATSSPDNGPIIAQAADSVDRSWPEAVWLRLSFRQKVRLGTWLVDALLAGKIQCDPARSSVSIDTPRPRFVGTEFLDITLRESLEAWTRQNAEPLGIENAQLP